MPSATSNAIAILDAVVGGPSTPAQRQRALAAFGTGMAGATSEEIAAIMVRDVRAFLINRVRSAEAQAAAQSVDEAFTPTP